MPSRRGARPATRSLVFGDPRGEIAREATFGFFSESEPQRRRRSTMKRLHQGDTEPVAAPGQGISGIHPAVAASPRVVLVVDDHEDLRFVLAEVLRGSGLRVMTVGSASDALIALA